jgi:hypothetical protein
LGVGHVVSSFLLVFLAVLLEVLKVRIVDRDDIKGILKIEAENDFVGRLAGTDIFARVEYSGNRIKEFYLYFIGIAGVKYA